MLCIRYLNPDTPDSQVHHLILHIDIRQISQLANFIQTLSEEKHLDPSLAMSLNLALEEAVSNVIMYAYPKDSDGLVEIEAILKDNLLEFFISDNGQPFDPTEAPQADVTLSAEERPIGGLGIYLVRSIMDSVSYERADGKNILHLTKQI
jgi:anti-sigma regulatory factor (Ser/Thr protein kinase)